MWTMLSCLPASQSTEEASDGSYEKLGII